MFSSSLFELIVNNWFVVFPLLLAGFLLVFIFVLHRQLRESREYLRRVPFFRIRDALRFQVATGTLNEDSEIYQHYDKLIQAILVGAEDMTIYNISKVFAKYGKELEAERPKRKKILELVSKSDPTIQKLVREFYSEIAWLLLVQSKLTFILGTIAIAVSECLDPGRLIRNVIPKDAAIYDWMKQARYRNRAKGIASEFTHCAA